MAEQGEQVADAGAGLRTAVRRLLEENLDDQQLAVRPRPTTLRTTLGTNRVRGRRLAAHEPRLFDLLRGFLPIDGPLHPHGPGVPFGGVDAAGCIHSFGNGDGWGAPALLTA